MVFIETSQTNTEYAKMLSQMSTQKSCQGEQRELTCGWLRRKTQRFGITRYVDRFFTVDFDAQTFYDSDTLFGLPKSKPTRFSDISWVERLPVQEEDEDEQERLRRASWKSSRGQMDAKQRAGHSRRIVDHKASWKSAGWLGMGKEVQQQGFVLQIGVTREEFFCASPIVAEKWIATMRAATSLRKDDAIKAADVDCSTRSCSSNESEPADVDDETEMEMEMETTISLGKVPVSTSAAQPGRYFTAASSHAIGKDSDPDDFPVHGSMAWLMEEAGKRNVDLSPVQVPQAKSALTDDQDSHPIVVDSAPLRDRLISRGKGPLPRDIKIP